MTNQQRKKAVAYFKSIDRPDLAEFYEQCADQVSGSVTVPGWELPERRLGKGNEPDLPAVTITASGLAKTPGAPPTRLEVSIDDEELYDPFGESPRRTVVLRQGPMSKTEFNERLALAKQYGEQAVLNICNEFRRRNTPPIELPEEPIGAGF
jgi:hypothetical protein